MADMPARSNVETAASAVRFALAAILVLTFTRSIREQNHGKYTLYLISLGTHSYISPEAANYWFRHTVFEERI